MAQLQANMEYLMKIAALRYAAHLLSIRQELSAGA
jgi:hypothetical protein